VMNNENVEKIKQNI